MASASDFFPEAGTAQWRFFERSSLQEPTFTFSSTSENGRRRIALDAPGHRFNGFFDRMTLTPEGLELNRIRFTNQVVDIPPWLLTVGPGDDRVENVLPSSLDGSFGVVRSPFTGVATDKVVSPSADGKAACWTIRLVITGIGGYVLDATIRFAARAGLCSYDGQLYGVFFLYDRVDEPACDGCR